MKESICCTQHPQEEGYVAEITVAGKPFKTSKLQLKYTGRKKSVIEGITSRNQPPRFAPLWWCATGDIPRGAAGRSRRVWVRPRKRDDGNHCRKKNLGGEVLCLLLWVR